MSDLDAILARLNDIESRLVELERVESIGDVATGWTAPTGTPSRATFNSDALTTRGGSYVQAEAQEVANRQQQTRQRLHALIVDLTTVGIIGS